MISTWSSGTGGAGIFGSFSYAALISIGVSPINTMCIMLIVPVIEAMTFWLLLRNPCAIPKNDSELSFTTSFTRSDDIECANENAEAKFTLGDKIRYLPSLLKYMVPFSAVFLFEYFINQGLVSIEQKATFYIIQRITVIDLFFFDMFSWSWFISKISGSTRKPNIAGCKLTIKLAYSFLVHQ